MSKFLGRVVGWVIGKTNGRAEPRNVTLKIRGALGSLSGPMQRGVSFQFQREAPNKLRDEQLEAFFAASLGPDLAVSILGVALDQLDGTVREGEALRPAEELAREALATAAAFLLALLWRRAGVARVGAAADLAGALAERKCGLAITTVDAIGRARRGARVEGDVSGRNVATDRWNMTVSHHSNSRRFRCACGAVYERWDESDVISCPCGRTHVRGATGGTALTAAKGASR